MPTELDVQVKLPWLHTITNVALELLSTPELVVFAALMVNFLI